MSRQTRQDPGWGLGLLPSEVTLILCIRSCVYMHVCICMCVYACVYTDVGTSLAGSRDGRRAGTGGSAGGSGTVKGLRTLRNCEIVTGSLGSWAG